MAHPIEATIREAYAAFARGDLDGYFRACSEDWNFNIAGKGAIAGTYRGHQGLYDLAQKAMAATSGTFQEEVEDVLGNDQHGIVLAQHRFTRDGRRHEYHTVHVYEIRAGKLASCWEHPRDQAAFDAAWGPCIESARR
jgi:ketosteroid isomerase-like protein